ncbi:MAG: hypothetical protein Q8P64_22635, partial [Deltaproteobacteria bacterium]|nr:hypothetical protein [Deltaproteobacteria bacterium]
KPESRVPGENRDPVFEMVPDFRRDDVWMPPYQVRGRLLKSGMTENAVYGQTLNTNLSKPPSLVKTIARIPGSD